MGIESHEVIKIRGELSAAKKQKHSIMFTKLVRQYFIGKSYNEDEKCSIQSYVKGRA